MRGRMGDMDLIAAYILTTLAVGLVVGIAFKSQAIGWVVAGIGVCFLVHAGVTIAIIRAHNNVVPAYVNYWGLFATIPTGLILVSAGGGVICIRSCLARMRKPPE
jgi:hypothetical protein